MMKHNDSHRTPYWMTTLRNSWWSAPWIAAIPTTLAQTYSNTDVGQLHLASCKMRSDRFEWSTSLRSPVPMEERMTRTNDRKLKLHVGYTDTHSVSSFFGEYTERYSCVIFLCEHPCAEWSWKERWRVHLIVVWSFRYDSGRSTWTCESVHRWQKRSREVPHLGNRTLLLLVPDTKKILSTSSRSCRSLCLTYLSFACRCPLVTFVYRSSLWDTRF